MPKVTLIAPAAGISAAVAPSFASRLALFPERFADPASKSSEDAAADSTFAALVAVNSLAPGLTDACRPAAPFGRRVEIPA
jgi:hypothetical protein